MRHKVHMQVCVLAIASFLAGTPAVAQVTYEEISNLSTEINGGLPWGGVVKGPDGALYGVMTQGSEYGSNAAYFRRGLVYRVALDGTTTVLHTFTGIPGDGEGYAPFGRLALGSDGNLYGMARGGNTDAFTGCGTGIIYRVTLSGVFGGSNRSMTCLNGARPTTKRCL